MINDFDVPDLLDGDWFSVSSGDAVSSVSGGDSVGNYYQINLYVQETTTEDITEETETLWTKPLEDYTVSEGLLLFLDVAVLVALVWFIVQGGFKWLK